MAANVDSLIVSILMKHRPFVITTPRLLLYRKFLLSLGVILVINAMSAQSEVTYSIRYVNQFPPDIALKKESFKVRISNLVFGQKPQQVIKPFGIVAFNPQNFWILDQGAGNILKYHNGSAEFFKPMLKAENEFPSLVGMTLLPGGEILCTDSRLNQVFKITEERLSIFSEAVTFSQPTGIAISKKKGEIWVVETGKHQVTVLNGDGEVLKRIGGRGSDPGLFNYPTFIWIDEAGRVYIVDSMNFRVQILDQEGGFLYSFGESGDATGKMARPKGVATDSEGNIYVVDALFHVVQIFDQEGNYLFNFGGQGQDAGEFWMPGGIFIDEQDFIYVSDSYNARIQVFERVQN